MSRFDNEIPRYKKKAKKKSPVKAKHKHEYQSCVYEYDALKMDRAHGFVEKTRRTIGTYCPICGKVGRFPDSSWFDPMWVAVQLGYSGGDRQCEMWSEDALRELDDARRTLPLFRLDDIFQKYVNPDQNGGGLSSVSQE